MFQNVLIAQCWPKLITFISVISSHQTASTSAFRVLSFGAEDFPRCDILSEWSMYARGEKNMKSGNVKGKKLKEGHRHLSWEPSLPAYVRNNSRVCLQVQKQNVRLYHCTNAAAYTGVDFQQPLRPVTTPCDFCYITSSLWQHLSRNVI